jgi:hypothetical protein
MKYIYLILLMMFSGCVSFEFPGLISDTAKVSKDAYDAIAGEDEAQKPAESTTASNEYITNAYIAKEDQSISEIRQLCVSEAETKFLSATGKEVRFTVIENTIATVNNTIVANCKLAVDKGPVEAQAKE